MEAQLCVLQRLLLSTLDPRVEIRSAAEQQLRLAQVQDLSACLQSLASLVVYEENGTAAQEDLLLAKQIAAVTFKNCISAKEGALDAQAAEKWMHIDEAVRSIIKTQILQALRVPQVQVANAVCQVLSKIALIELYNGTFEQLLPSLRSLVVEAVDTPQPSALSVKSFGRNALTCVSFFCEELAERVQEGGESPDDILLSDHCNILLTIIIHGLKDQEPVMKVAALRALYHALVFAKQNFERKEERDYVVGAVVESCKFQQPQVQVAAFECLVQIAQEYYQLLGPYMPAIGPLTWAALACPDDSVCIAAMEVWNVIADVELFNLEMQTPSGTQSNPPLCILEQALPFLLPLLLTLLTKQESEELDEGTWTPAMAAGTCLGSCAQVVKDLILPDVLEFVRANFRSSEWTHREAAVLAFGCVMEGPDTQKLQPYVAESFAELVRSLDSDPSVAVRDSAAWTLGRVAQHHTPVVLILLHQQRQEQTQTETQNLLAAVVNRLADEPRVAVHICWMLHEVADHMNSLESTRALEAQGAGVNFQERTPDDKPVNAPLDPLFPKLCDALIHVSERPDADDRNLREAAFNCLGALIHNAGESCRLSMFTLLEHFVAKLRESFGFEQSEQTKQRQGMLCGVIQILCLRLGVDVKPAATQLWSCLSRVFVSRDAQGSIQNVNFSESSSTDALLALSALVNACGSITSAFAEELVRVVLNGLQMAKQPAHAQTSESPDASSHTAASPAVDELQAVRICIEICGDLSRALGSEFNRFAEPVLGSLYNILKDPDVDRSLKPCVIVAVGDIAMNIGGAFLKYGLFMELLSQAGNTRYDAGPFNWQTNEEWLWYVHDLRESVLQTYVSIVYASKENQNEVDLRPHVNGMLEIIKTVAEAPLSTHGVNSNIQQAIELTGDLVSTFGKELAAPLSQAPFVLQLLQRAKAREATADTQMLLSKATWLQNLLVRYA